LSYNEEKTHITFTPPRVSRKLGVLLAIALPICLASMSHAQYYWVVEDTQEWLSSNGATIPSNATGFNTQEFNGGRAEVNRNAQKIWAKAWGTGPTDYSFHTFDSSGSLRVEKQVVYRAHNSLTNNPQGGLQVIDSVSHVDMLVNFSGGTCDPGVPLAISSWEPFQWRKAGASSNFHLIYGTANYIDITPCEEHGGPHYSCYHNNNTYTGDSVGIPVIVEDAPTAQLSYSGGWFSNVFPQPCDEGYGVPGGWGGGIQGNYISSTLPRRMLRWASYAGAAGSYWYAGDHYFPGVTTWGGYNTQAEISVGYSSLLNYHH
jgi:hypothetical protein